MKPFPDPWQRVIAQLASILHERGVHPARAVVLVPYAQLMDVARKAWHSSQHSVFTPRFETTSNWARNVAPFAPVTDDLHFDMAHDALTAASLLARAGLKGAADESLHACLTSNLVESAYQLAAPAAAVLPAQRTAWAAQAGAALAGSFTASALVWEAAVAQLALAWAANSAYATDVLFSSELKTHVDCLFVVEGFQADPLLATLQAHFGDKALACALNDIAPRVPAHLHKCQDAQDEAERACACVLTHINAGRTPVALPAQDREQTHRIAALLTQSGVSLRDETGWTLSTTRAEL